MALALNEVEQERQIIAQALKGNDDEAKMNALSRVIDLEDASASQLGLAADVAQLVRSEGDEEVKIMAVEALGAMGELAGDYADYLVPVIQGSDSRFRCVALGSMGLLGPGASMHAPVVAGCLKDNCTAIRAAACCALGNIKAPGYVDAVAACVSDSASDVSHAALVALASLEAAPAKKHADKVAAKLGDQNKEVRMAAVQYFAELSDLVPQNVQQICKLLTDEEIAVRQAVAGVFGKCKDGHAALLAAAGELLGHQDSRFKAAAALAIAGLKEKGLPQAEAVAALLEDLTEDRSQLVNCMAGVEQKAPAGARIPACAAMMALCAMGHEASCPRIAKVLQTTDSVEVKTVAAETLGDLSRDVEALLPLLDVPQAQLRASAAAAVGNVVSRTGKPTEAVANKVAQLLAEKSPIVRAAAAEALGQMGDEGAAYTETLQQLFNDSSTAVRSAAVIAMGGVGVKGQMFAAEICRQMYEDGPDFKIAAAKALALMGDRGAAFADEVSTLTMDKDGEVRLAALESLSNMGEEASGYLKTAAHNLRHDQLKEVRDAAERLLRA